MSHRKINYLNKLRVVYRQNPINDLPTYSTQHYEYYENGTHEYYNLFNNKSLITTYKSLKWHFLVIYYLNIDGVDGDEVALEDDMRYIFKFIANKENGFVTFFIKQKILDSMIKDVLEQGGDPPKNRIRKVIFKDYNGLSFQEKMKIVGQLSGRSTRINEEDIYEAMICMSDKITISKIAKLLNCSTRTVHRKMSKELKKEKYKLNEKI